MTAPDPVRPYQPTEDEGWTTDLRRRSGPTRQGGVMLPVRGGYGQNQRRGEGRRSLRDGQRVSLRVAQSDKGPQAEDVEAIGGG